MDKILRIPLHEIAPSRRGFLEAVGAVGIALVLPLPLAGCPDGEAEPRVTLHGPGEVEAGASGTWTLEVVAGPGGLPAGASVAVTVEHGTDWGAERTLAGGFAERLGGVSAEAEGDAVVEVVPLTVAAAYNGVVVEVVEGVVEPGQRLWITVGDESVGALLPAPTIAHDAVIHVSEQLGDDRTEDGFLVYTELLPTPQVAVRPLEPAAVAVMARSHARPGEPLSLVVRVEDRFGNAAAFGGTVQIRVDDQLLAEVVYTPLHRGVRRIEGAVIDQAGTWRLRVEVPELGLVGWGGPVEVYDDPEHQPVRWGEIHGHTLVSDGLGTPRGWYAHARDVSNLDFAALTDHGYLTERVVDHQFFRHYIDAPTWASYAATCRDAHQPGEFVTFLAYEWSSNAFGDKNVYFLHDDEPWQPYPGTVGDLVDRYLPRAHVVTVVSHMMWAVPLMRGIDWTRVDDTLERLVEVASVHGVREYAGNDYWDDPWMASRAEDMEGHLVIDGLWQGLRLGLVCASDTHTGLPGNSHSGRHPSRCAGTMGVRTTELTREAIWERWQQRRVFGTTGPRVLVDFWCDGVPMGSEITASGARHLEVRVRSPVPVVRVDLVRGDPRAPVLSVVYDEPVWDPDDIVWDDEEPLVEATFYYVRVHLDGGDLAWSSPVFVQPS